MSKENLIKSAFAIAIAGLTAYFHVMIIPLAVLIIVMLCDYITGVASAWINGTLSSRTGIIGIVKKILYMFAVAVGMVLDWIIQTALAQTNMKTEKEIFLFGLIVIIWLIINELISCLENLAEAKVPLPPFLIKIVSKLKNTVEKSMEDDNSD